MTQPTLSQRILVPVWAEGSRTVITSLYGGKAFCFRKYYFFPFMIVMPFAAYGASNSSGASGSVMIYVRSEIGATV